MKTILNVIIIGHGTLMSNPEKISDIFGFPKQSSVRGFSRMCGKFNENYSAPSIPLTDLIRKRSNFERLKHFRRQS